MVFLYQPTWQSGYEALPHLSLLLMTRELLGRKQHGRLVMDPVSGKYYESQFRITLTIGLIRPGSSSNKSGNFIFSCPSSSEPLRIPTVFVQTVRFTSPLFGYLFLDFMESFSHAGGLWYETKDISEDENHSYLRMKLVKTQNWELVNRIQHLEIEMPRPRLGTQICQWDELLFT